MNVTPTIKEIEAIKIYYGEVLARAQEIYNQWNLSKSN